MIGQPIADLEKVTEVPSGSLYIANMGDGSGTKAVTQETLTKEVGKGLKVGDLAELQTENKNNLVAAINEAAQSGGGGAAVDILDTKEEIEANTESGKAAGAQAVKEMFGALNDNLNGNILTYNESEDAYYIQHGADAVPKKLGSSVELTLYGSYSGNRTITLPDNLVDKHFILIPTTISGTVSAGEYKNDSKPFSFSPAISKNGKTLSITGCSYSATLGIALTMGAAVSYGIYYW